jgi:hypothetical protein
MCQFDFGDFALVNTATGTVADETGIVVVVVEVIRPPGDFEDVIFAAWIGFLIERDGLFESLFANVAPLRKMFRTAKKGLRGKMLTAQTMSEIISMWMTVMLFLSFFFFRAKYWKMFLLA